MFGLWSLAELLVLDGPQVSVQGVVLPGETLTYWRYFMSRSRTLCGLDRPLGDIQIFLVIE